jgi:uracil DNA glycosylase
MIKNESRCVMGVHPSPLSAYNGFFNSDIFKKVEEKLNHQINWQN